MMDWGLPKALLQWCGGDVLSQNCFTISSFPLVLGSQSLPNAPHLCCFCQLSAQNVFDVSYFSLHWLLGLTFKTPCFRTPGRCLSFNYKNIYFELSVVFVIPWDSHKHLDLFVFVRVVLYHLVFPSYLSISSSTIKTSQFPSSFLPLEITCTFLHTLMF
jgi:hypothetical protein